ncbi:MAG: taurine dioxygenase [Rhodospirillaceae bacterium]|nr:taurine dioxygenase [Rhodospirillaceae bacterium]
MDLGGELDINFDNASGPLSDKLVVRPIGRVAGAELPGLDLRSPLAEENINFILTALAKYHVLSFPDQDLTKDQQVLFTKQFGELEGHVALDHSGKPFPAVHIVSNLDPDGQPTAKPRSHGNYFWHSDKSYHATPSLATILYAKEIPPNGGATQFANMQMAYDELYPEMKQMIDGLEVVHHWAQSRRNSCNAPATPEQEKESPPVTHPIVRVHPETNRKSIYLGIHASHVAGMNWHEGREIIYRLTDMVTQPRFVYTHEWKKNEVVMWDNRSLMHRATGDFDQALHPRVLHRTVLRGAKPMSP